MNLDELRQAIAFLFADGVEIGIALYMVVREAEGLAIKFADIEDDVATDLRAKYFGFLRSKLILDDELVYGAISNVEEEHSKGKLLPVSSLVRKSSPVAELLRELSSLGKKEHNLSCVLSF
jgi:hypothetical protein